MYSHQKKLLLEFLHVLLRDSLLQFFHFFQVCVALLYPCMLQVIQEYYHLNHQLPTFGEVFLQDNLIVMYFLLFSAHNLLRYKLQLIKLLLVIHFQLNLAFFSLKKSV